MEGRGGRGAKKVKDFDQTEHDHLWAERDSGGGRVFNEVATGQTDAQSLSGHCKTTTTLHVSFPVTFLSLVLSLATGR